MLVDGYYKRHVCVCVSKQVSVCVWVDSYYKRHVFVCVCVCLCVRLCLCVWGGAPEGGCSGAPDHSSRWTGR